MFFWGDLINDATEREKFVALLCTWNEVHLIQKFVAENLNDDETCTQMRKMLRLKDKKFKYYEYEVTAGTALYG